MADVKRPSRESRVRKDLVFLGIFLFLLLIVFGPFLAVGGGPVTMTGEGSSLRQACYLIVAGLIFIALKPWENYQRILAIPLPLMIGLAWCWLSLVWAIEPSIAVRRLFLTTLIMWTLFASLRQLKFEEVVLLLRWALCIVLIANYISVFVAPTYAIHGGNAFDELSLAGDWRGLLQHKNLAGAVCAITMIFFAFDRRSVPRWLQIVVILGAAYFLYRTNSKTSFGLSFAALFVGFLFQAYKRKYRGVILALLCVLAVGATVMEAIYQNPLTAQLDDPKAFTGRTQIWNALIRFALDHPLFGSGYGSFWAIGPSSPIFTYASGEIRDVPNGHNGFLDILVQLGFPGLILIVTVAIILPVKKMLDSPIAIGSRGGLLCALFFFCIGHNATESTLMDRDMLVWVVLMIAMALSQPNLINYKRQKFDVHKLLRVGPRTSRVSGGEPTQPSEAS